MSWLVPMLLDRQALARCRFRDSYAWHQALWECFPAMPDAGRDFLTRTDWLPQGCRIYLLCRREPVRPDWCPPGSWAVKNIAPAFLQQGQHPAPQQAAHTDRRGGKGPGRPGAHAAGRHQGRQSRPTAGRGRRPQCEGGQNRYGCRSPNGICRHKNAPPCTISMRGGALCMPDGFTFCCWKPWRKLRAHCPCSAFPPSRWRSW